MFGSLSKNLVMVEGQSNLFVLSAAAAGLQCVNNTLHTTSFLSPLWIQQTGVAFFVGFFFFWMEKRSASLCSIILLSALLPNTRPSTSLLIFMDLSANGLVILLRSESPVSVSPSSLCRVCLVILNPLQTGEGRANWPPPSSFLFCYLVRCSPPPPAPPPRQSV